MRFTEFPCSIRLRAVLGGCSPIGRGALESAMQRLQRLWGFGSCARRWLGAQCRERIHHQFHTNLKITHAMMEKRLASILSLPPTYFPAATLLSEVKHMISAYEKALAEPKPTEDYAAEITASQNRACRESAREAAKITHEARLPLDALLCACSDASFLSPTCQDAIRKECCNCCWLLIRPCTAKLIAV
eukprot:993504-Amphidinium_carterae.1